MNAQSGRQFIKLEFGSTIEQIELTKRIVMMPAIEIDAEPDRLIARFKRLGHFVHTLFSDN